MFINFYPFHKMGSKDWRSSESLVLRGGFSMTGNIVGANSLNSYSFSIRYHAKAIFAPFAGVGIMAGSYTILVDTNDGYTYSSYDLEETYNFYSLFAEGGLRIYLSESFRLSLCGKFFFENEAESSTVYDFADHNQYQISLGLTWNVGI